MKKCLQILGVMFLINIVMFILFSDDFYMKYTVIPFPVLYTIELPFVILFITYIMIRFFKIEKKYKVVIFIMSAVIYVAIPKGVMVVVDDVLQHYYHTTSYNSLLGFSSYTKRTGNLWSVKYAAVKKGIVGGKITQGLSSDYQNRHDISPQYYKEVIYMTDSKWFFIYDWRTKEITNIKYIDELKEECSKQLGTDGLKSGQSFSINNYAARIWKGDILIQSFYLLPKDGEFILKRMHLH